MREGEEGKEVEQKVPPTTKSLVGPRVPATKKKYPVVWPYVRRISEQLRRVFRSFNIPAYFKPTTTLQQLLVQPKDKVEKRRVVGPVYHITCDDCDATYIGEIERALKTRFSEHQRKSSVGSEVSHVHVDRPEHGMSLDKVKILTVDNRRFEMGVMEAMYIRVMEPRLDKNGGRYQQCGLTC